MTQAVRCLAVIGLRASLLLIPTTGAVLTLAFSTNAFSTTESWQMATVAVTANKPAHREIKPVHREIII